PNILNSGLYFKKINTLLKYFSSENILVVLYEDMKERPNVTLKTIYSFLGVDENFKPNSASKRVNESATPRNKMLFKIVFLIKDLLRSIKLDIIVEKLKPFLSPLVLKKNISIPNKNQYLKQLKNYYINDINNLSNFLGRDLLELWGIKNEESVK